MSPVISRHRLTALISRFDSIDGFSRLIDCSSLVVLGLAVGGAPKVAIAIAGSLCALALVFKTRKGIVGGLSGRGALGRHPVVRVCLLASAAVVVADEPAGLSTTGWAALGLLSFGVVLEPALRRLIGVGGASIANLPEIQMREEPWFGHGMTTNLGMLGLVLAGVAALTDSTFVPALVAAALSILLLIVAAIDNVLLSLQRQRANARLMSVLENYGPTFALYWHAAGGTDYQIRMWVPYLERLGKKFMVIVRTPTNFREACALTSAPVLLRGGHEQLDDVVVPSLRSVFYVNNAVRNLHMVRFPQLKHIQLNHGDSDKAPSFNPVMRMYDKNFVAGPAAIDRFAANGVDAPASLFEIVGRPQVEDVQIATTSIASIERPKVLYAPTWFGFTADSRYSSLGVGLELVTALVRRGADVIFRPHPYARRTPQFRAAIDEIFALLAAENARGAGHVFGEEAEQTLSIFDCFNRADAMISDVSSVVADFLYSEKPMAAVAVLSSPVNFVDEFPLSRACYVIDAHHSKLKPKKLEARLDELLKTDPLASTRRELKTYYLGDFDPENYAQHFLDSASRYV